MSTSVFVALIGSWVLTMILYIYGNYYKNKYDLSELKKAELSYTLKEMEKENSVLKEAAKIKHEGEKKTDEKINELHNGDSISNAVNGLCKH